MRLLLVEDDNRFAAALLEGLADNGFDVDRAADGEEGLYRAREWEYDVIILDLMLPELDGRTLLEQLRRDKPTPVLILTAVADLESRVDMLDLGADDYVAKPFDLPELVARLRALARRSLGLASERFEAGDLVLDRRRRDVSIDGQAKELTGNEFRILELLAQRAGQPVSRAELLDRLPENERHGSNIVEVYVYRLRQKLGRGRITNRRGVGYVLEVISR